MKRLVPADIGGPYGFLGDEVLRTRHGRLHALAHDLLPTRSCEAIFADQIYRAFTILNNEPYHHE